MEWEHKGSIAWVQDKERLLHYLSHFSEVLYEGHDSPEMEIARFEKLGFSRHTILGTTDARRFLIHFSKCYDSVYSCVFPLFFFLPRR